MNDLSQPDVDVASILSHPQLRLRLIIAIRECKVDYSFPGGPAISENNDEAFIALWTKLAQALYQEANHIRSRVGLPAVEYRQVHFPPSPLPPCNWSNLQQYRELFEFWYPDMTLPAHANVIAACIDMRKLLTRHFPDNSPFAAFVQREAFDQLSREFFQ